MPRGLCCAMAWDAAPSAASTLLIRTLSRTAQNPTRDGIPHSMPPSIGALLLRSFLSAAPIFVRRPLQRRRRSHVAASWRTSSSWRSSRAFTIGTARMAVAFGRRLCADSVTVIRLAATGVPADALQRPTAAGDPIVRRTRERLRRLPPDQPEARPGQVRHVTACYSATIWDHESRKAACLQPDLTVGLG